MTQDIIIQSANIAGLEFILSPDFKLKACHTAIDGITDKAIDQEKALLFDDTGALSLSKALAYCAGLQAEYGEILSRSDKLDSQITYPEYPEGLLVSDPFDANKKQRLDEMSINSFADCKPYKWTEQKIENWRADKLALLADYRKACKEIDRASGLTAIYERLGVLFEIESALSQAIAALPVSSAHEVHAKLRAFMDHDWANIVDAGQEAILQLIATAKVN